MQVWTSWDQSEGQFGHLKIPMTKRHYYANTVKKGANYVVIVHFPLHNKVVKDSKLPDDTKKT